MASLNENTTTGIYCCGNCGHMEVHKKGTKNCKCEICGENDKFALIVSTAELEKVFKLDDLYQELIEVLKSRYDFAKSLKK